MRSLFITIPIVIFLSSCATSEYLGRNPEDYLANGSTITLNQPIRVPRNAVAAGIRGGSIGTLHEFEGHCRIELWSISSEERFIEPDEFTVVRTNWQWEYFGGFHPLNSYAGILTSEGPNLFWYTTYIYLESPQQPDVYRLRCRHLQESDVDPRYLTVAQMQAVMGEVMTLVPKSVDSNLSGQ